jgi:uncharacterized protein
MMTRRKFLKAFTQVMATCAVAGTGLYDYGTQVEPEQVVVERLQIPIEGLDSALEGLRIVQISDIHIDAYTHLETVQKATSLVNSLKPDLIVLTGDYVTENAEAIFELQPYGAALNAKYGIFASLGNHELWTDPALVRAALEKMGFPVLVNSGVALGIGKGLLYLAGVDDCWSGQPDLGSALAGLPANVPAVLLAHEPDFADLFAADGRVALQLSGHTHGGQVRLPGYGAILLPPFGKKYDQGLYQIEGMWLYTNRGLGLGPVSFRVNCPPEITEFTLI